MRYSVSSDRRAFLPSFSIRKSFPWIVAAVASLCSPALSQGLIEPGHVMGNGTSAIRTPTNSALSPVFDQAFCATNGKTLTRTAGLWVCGNFPTATLSNQTFTTPGAVTTLTLTNTPLPTAKGEITIFFDGIAQHPNTWSVVIGTGVITFNATIPANTQEVFIQWAAANVASVGVTSVGAMSGVITLGGGLFANTGSNVLNSTGPVTANVVNYGAVGDCSTDDTTAVQNAWNAAKAAGGQGVVYFPPVPSGGCYKIQKINGTGATGIRVIGNGPQSLLKITSKDSSNNWWDVSCSYHISFENLKIIDDGVVIPDNVFLWGWCGSVLVSGLMFDRVYYEGRFVKSAVYVFGHTGGGSGGTENVSTTLGAGFVCRDSTFRGLYGTGNGAQTDPSLRAAPLRFQGRNVLSVTSAYQTLGANTVDWHTRLDNCNAVDAPTSGYGGGVRTNNAAIIFVTSGAIVTITGGSFLCLCETSFVSWYDTEGFSVVGARVGSADAGDVNTVGYAFRFGGPAGTQDATVGVVTLDHFFIAGAVTTAVIAFENPGSAFSGYVVGEFNVIAPDVGGNPPPNFLNYTGLACTLPNTPPGWIGNSSRIDIPNGMTLVACGDIDWSTILNNPGTISNSNPGVQKTGCKFRPSIAMVCNAAL